MQSAIRRTRFRVLIAFAAVVVPLLAVGSANGAMAGANPSTTTLRPDLRSAQITAVNTTTGVTTIQVCFDKQIGSTPDASSFFVGNYRQNEVQADSAARNANGSCADVTWSSQFIDPQQRTYVTAGEDAVVNAANGLFNLEDSVALNGSSTHNGTRGHTTAPDLEGITVNTGLNTINYTFDQFVGAVSPFNPDFAQCFAAWRQDGTKVEASGIGSSVTFSGNTVFVKFANTLQPVAGNPIVQSTVRPLCVTDTTPGGPGLTSINPTEMTATAPGTGGFTTKPDLIAVTQSDASHVDFTFDTTIAFASGKPDEADFLVGSSYDNGPSCVNDGGETIVNGNTVEFPLTGVCSDGSHNGDAQNEYFVWGSVFGGVVQSSANSSLKNPEAGVPMGGNAGAFANGFTTGPEAFSTTFDSSNGVVSAVVDQRFTAFQEQEIILVDDTGNELPFSPTNVSGAGGSAGPQVMQAQFTPGEVAGARSLLLDPGALTTDVGYTNVPQILAPASAPARLQRKHGHVVRHHTSKRQAKRIRAHVSKRIRAHAS